MPEDHAKQHRCGVCDRLKDPVEIQIRSAATSNSETTLDRLRGFIPGSGEDSQANGRSVNTPEMTDTDNEKEALTGVFYICPHLPCEGREDDVREMEKWELKNDPDRNFTEEKLEDIVTERVELEKNDHRIITETADEVYNNLIEDSKETLTEESTGDDSKTNDS